MNDKIDLQALRNLKSMIGDDFDDLAELIEDFVTGLPTQMQHMHDHSARGDLAALRIVAHSCKSNARDLGAVSLASLCATLETDCAAGLVDDLPSQLDGISSAIDAALKNYSTLDLSNV